MKVSLVSGLVSILLGCAATASEEKVRLEAQFVTMDGTPLAQTPVRIVVGDIPAARDPLSGQKLTTDAEGRIALDVTAPVKTRRVSLDNVLVRHQTQLLEIGVELELRGQPALYWIELDVIKEGTAGLMKAFVAGPNGSFDRLLDFHPDTHSWSIPGDPQGLMMSGIGAELKFHEMQGAPGEGWTVRLTIEKHEFTMR